MPSRLDISKELRRKMELFTKDITVGVGEEREAVGGNTEARRITDIFPAVVSSSAHYIVVIKVKCIIKFFFFFFLFFRVF